MNIESYGKTDIGKKRQRNEDAFLDDNDHRLYAVADGLGGLAGGDRASELAVTLLKAHQRAALKEGRPLDFRRIFADADQAIQKLGAEIDPMSGSGTTLTAARIHEDKILIAHIGDSAAYLFRSDGWEKLSTDHTEAEEFRKKRPGETVPPIFEHTLTACLGQPGKRKSDFFSHSLRPGDRLFLCTDGITRDIDPEEIQGWVKEIPRPRDLVEEVIKLANRRGGGDNLTAVAVYID